MSNQIIIGQILGNEDDGYKSLVSVTDVHTAMSQIGYSYETKAIMSLDGLFVPFSTDPSETVLPHFVAISGSVSGAAEPAVDDLDPFSGRSNVPQILTPQGGLPDNLYGAEDGDNHYKGLALKMPLVLSGWGFNSSGTIVPEGVNYKDRLDLWKTGPLDSRWDEARGVWTATGLSTHNHPASGVLTTYPHQVVTNVVCNSGNIEVTFGTIYSLASGINPFTVTVGNNT